MSTLLVVSLIFNGLTLFMWLLYGYIEVREAYIKLKKIIKEQRK